MSDLSDLTPVAVLSIFAYVVFLIGYVIGRWR